MKNVFLDKFKESPRDKPLYLITILGFLIVLFAYIFVFIPIEASIPIYGILDYEFVWTEIRAEAILSVWGVEGISSQSSAIYWDFLFIVGYSSLALSLIILVLRKTEGKFQKLGLYFTLTPFLTGLFDIIENINLLIMMNNPTSVSMINAFTASLSALIKFSFLFAAIIYFLVGLIIIIIGRVKKY